ncbi:MAG: DNA primase [Bacteroidaceae bacterium]|nr:DNA primase [Bacteroidaceae bacterium]
MIDQATIDRILNTAQIVDVVSEFVTLKKRGVNYIGLCPFHNEKTPSFSVSPSKGICKCFSCGKGGNVVHFIMEHEQMSYYEALKFLAKKYNIDIHERELTDEEKIAQTTRESLFIVNSFARDYFHHILKEDVDGRSIGLAYFHKRGFRDDIIEKFQLGYSTEKRDGLTKEALKKGYSKEYLIKTGLCYERADHLLQDRFWGRVIFPVHTLSGKVVAFGGRVLSLQTKKVMMKYVNSPESEIYHKSNELFGIFFAKQAIVKYDRCYLVEGYTDMISMFQTGVENTVASSGTSLTSGQIRLIHRFTNNITVLYDGDMAGIKASIRGIDMLLCEGMNVRVCLLPDNDDPDSYAQKHTSEEFKTFINNHEVDFIRFKTNLLLEDAGKDPIKKAKLIGDIVQSIAVIPEAIVRDVYIKECGSQLNVEEKLLVAEVAKRRDVERDKEKKANLNILRHTGNASLEEKSTDQALQTTSTVQTISGQTYNNTLPEDTYKSFIPQEGKEGFEFYKYERLILQVVLRYGEKILCEIKNDKEESVPVTVIEYVVNDLKQDELSFHNPLHRQLLAEAAKHVHDEGFNTKRYFLSHPNPEISKLSVDLINVRYELSKMHSKITKVVTDGERLLDLVPKLMINFKYAIVTEEITHTMRALQNPQLNHEEKECNEIMIHFNNLRKIQNKMAKHLGDRVTLTQEV